MLKCEVLESLLPGDESLRNALIIDDEWKDGSSSFIDDILLEELKLWFQEEESRDRFEDFIDENTSITVDEFNEFLNKESIILDGTLLEKVQSGQDSYLQKLYEFLKLYNFSCKGLNADINFDLLDENTLIFIDYQMPSDDAEGENAISIIKRISEHYCSKRLAPPILVLMSKKLKNSDSRDWERVADFSGYFRFNFDFVSKINFQTENVLNFTLYNLYKYKTSSHIYFNTLQAFETEAKSIASSVVKELFKITPAEIHYFNGKVIDDGTDLSSALNNLFIECFSKKTNESEEISIALDNFTANSTPSHLMPPKDSHVPILNKLQSQLLYEVISSNSPQFGYIYSIKNRDEDRKVYLVISQDCDIACGLTRSAKVNNVLCIQGEVCKGVLEPENENTIHIPYWEENKYIKWNVKEALTYSMKMLRRRKPKFRLRRNKAEHIRNFFIENISRLAFDVEPDPIKKIKIQCIEIEDKKESNFGEISLAILIKDHIRPYKNWKLHIAIDVSYELMSLDLKEKLDKCILSLQTFQGITDFLANLAEHNMYLWIKDERICSLIYTDRPKNPPRKTGWKVASDSSLSLFIKKLYGEFDG